MIKIIECPRDAMQGVTSFIPTQKKIEYINQLLRVGFDTLDFGSFVSPKAIPQMADTHAVFEGLDLEQSNSKLLAIVANVRGGEEACRLAGISFIGFPLSISETFQLRNTNKSIAEGLNTLNELKNLSLKSGKELIVYLSMGFGNPYHDPYDSEIVLSFSGVLQSIGVNIISLADTIGVSQPDQIRTLFESISKEFSKIEFGVHLHSHPFTAHDKIMAAMEAGCTRFDGALLGFGGCPMATDELVGNIDTQTILNALEIGGYSNLLDQEELEKSVGMAAEIFQERLT